MRKPLIRLVALTSLGAVAYADLSFVNFFSTQNLQLVGNATGFGTRLRLTSSGTNQRGAAWALAKQNVTAPWVTEFRIELVGTADGMAFVIQNADVAALGANGGSLGYGNIPNSVAIEFDPFTNGELSDPSSNHVSVHTRGTAPNDADHAASLGHSSLIPDINDGAVHDVRIEYVPGALRVFVDGTIPALQVDIDLEATLSLTGGEAWVGFTAATGGLGQAHYVHSWSFDENSSVATSNRPPSAPVVLSPTASGGATNPGGLTFQLSPFVDPNGDGHACTEYEIWSVATTERVWRAACPTGQGTLAATLADGVFEGSLAGQTSLEASKLYVARARVQDASGDPLSSWSGWGESEFLTGAIVNVTALSLSDVQALPLPALTYAASGRTVELPAGATPARIVLESAGGAPLVTVEGRSGTGNAIADAPALPQAGPLRARITAGSDALETNPLDLVVFDQDCERVRVVLPALSLGAGQSAEFWIGEDGSTWDAIPGATVPFFSTVARELIASWNVRPGYELQVVAEGLELPMNMAFVPNPGDGPGDPFLYVLELYGTIKVVTNDGTVSDFATGLLNYNPLGQFPGAGEQGLGGIVVDPQSGDVFLSLLYDAGGPHYPRVERFTSLDGGLTAATRTTILDMPGETQGQAHYIAHLELLGDGTLFVHMGDGFVPSTARNLNSYRGKILRVNLDGTPPTDNPFYTAGSVTARDYVYALGLRNPFGGRMRASDGVHYFVENGPSTDRFARLVPGRDYLWDGQDSDMLNFALLAWAPAVGPVNLAWIESATFGGSGFPASMMDHGFVSEAGPTYEQGPTSRGKKISEYEVNSQGVLTAGPTDFVRYVGQGRSTVVGLAAGHDGLYFTDLYREIGNNPIAEGARVYRVKYVGEPPYECGQLGVTYCSPAAVNSSGDWGRLGATGSPAVADDDLTFEARSLPSFTFALLVGSRTQGFVPNAGGGAGTLCLGGTIGRFNALITNSGAAGAFDLPLALGSFPPPLTQAMPGETWNFQLWYRDVQLVQTSNYTNALSIQFQ